MNNKRIDFAVYLMVFTTLTDQMTKWAAINSISRQDAREIYMTSFFNVVLTWNRGVTFGFLNHESFAHDVMPWMLIGAAVLILFLLGRWLVRTNSTLVAVSLGAIMGGAVGNVIDRLRYGAVIDFLDFHYAGYHWYAFNIADAAIVTGIGLLLLESLVRGR